MLRAERRFVASEGTVNSKPVLVAINFASILCFALLRRGTVRALYVRFACARSRCFLAPQTLEVVLRVVAAVTAIVLVALRSTM